MITGASAGIGKSTALAFAAEGTHLALGARRVELLEDVARQIRDQFGVWVWTKPVDVCDTASVEAFVQDCHQEFGRIDILLNNAGLALGTATVANGVDGEWETMLNTNVMGVLRTTRAVLAFMLKQDFGGHIINLGSLAGHLSYPGGSVYCASKHALRAITETLRLEVHGKPIRVSSVDPGLVETEFSQVRFRGDVERAAKVYQGMIPLTADDIAECVVFIASRPPHVNIDKILINPTDQAGLQVHRRPVDKETAEPEKKSTDK